MDFSNEMIDSERPDLDQAGAELNSPSNPMLSPRFNAISHSLQRIFGKVVQEPLPERLQDLIQQVERASLKNK